MAEIIGGTAGGSIGEPFNLPLTAHFIGGCTIGDTPETGVIDPYQRVYGHPGLHVVDGSAISANLGVNPSLTITAQAERAMAFWPNKGEADPRPPLGEGYQRVPPVVPAHPVVPDARARGAAAADRRRQLISRPSVPEHVPRPRGTPNGTVRGTRPQPEAGPGREGGQDPGRAGHRGRCRGIARC